MTFVACGDATSALVTAGATQAPDVVVGGVTVPGAAVVAAGREFARNPSAESAANAAMQVACVAATSGVASAACGLLTVDNVNATVEWFAGAVDAVLQSLGIGAHGVLPCDFYFADVTRAIGDQILTIDTALYKTWYATRTALGLPLRDCAAEAVYSDRTCKARVAGSGECKQWEAPKLLGYRTIALNSVLATDPVWNDFGLWGRRFAGSKGDRWIHVLPGSLAWRRSPMPEDCAKYVGMVTKAFAELLVRSRLHPVQRGAKQVIKMWGEEFDREKAELDAWRREFGEGLRKRSERQAIRNGLQRWLEQHQTKHRMVKLPEPRSVKLPSFNEASAGPSYERSQRLRSVLPWVVLSAFCAGALASVAAGKQ